MLKQHRREVYVLKWFSSYRYVMAECNAKRIKKCGIAQYRKYCVNYNCSSIQISNVKSNIKFHKFPRDKKLCNIWLIKSGRLDLKLKKCYDNGLHKYSSYRLCSLHFQDHQYASPFRKKLRQDAIPSIFRSADNQFTSSLRRRINKFGIPTIFPKNTDTNGSPDAPKINEIITSLDSSEGSLKRLNTLIKELENTKAVLNQGIDIAEGDIRTYSHIKKEVDETAILTFEDITAEDRGIKHDCNSRKNCKNLNILTYEEITSGDMMDMNETLTSKQSEVLNNSFEEKYSSLDVDKEIKLEIIDDQDKFKSIQEQIYTFSGISSGDDCDRKDEFEMINPILKTEIEDTVKLEMGLFENIGKFEKIKDEIQKWDEVKTVDDHNLSKGFDIKEEEFEDISEVNIKMEEVFDDKETISSTLSLKRDGTYKDIPFSTYQISKQNNLLTSENNFSRSVSRDENHISKIGSYEPSAISEISYNKKNYQTTQAITNKEAKSFVRSRSDRFSFSYSSANENENYLVNKVDKKNSDQGNAGIIANSSRTSSDPNKQCLKIPVEKNIVYIKLKQFKRKKKTLV